MSLQANTVHDSGRLTPLCPAGHLPLKGDCRAAGLSLPISPLEGEMSRSDRGGYSRYCRVLRHTKRLTLAALLLAGAAAISACQRETGPDPLELTGKMFVFNYRLAYATYMITLTKTEPVPEGSTVVATFENPAGGAPLMLDRKLFAKLDKVVLESPDVTCVKKEHPYAVTIEVKGPDGAILQTLRTTVTSNLDQDVLPAEALVVGPAYDKNPEVFKDGKAPEHFETASCPS